MDKDQTSIFVKIWRFLFGYKAQHVWKNEKEELIRYDSYNGYDHNIFAVYQTCLITGEKRIIEEIGNRRRGTFLLT